MRKKENSRSQFQNNKTYASCTINLPNNDPNKIGLKSANTRVHPKLRRYPRFRSDSPRRKLFFSILPAIFAPEE